MKKWILFCGLFLLLSCNQNSSLMSSRPKGVLSKEKMIQLMVDINLAESVIRAADIQRTRPADSLYQKAQFAAVYQKNGVKPSEFDRSLTYYIEHVDDLNDIYLEVISRLSAKEAELKGSEKKKEAESKKSLPKSPEKDKNPQ